MSLVDAHRRGKRPRSATKPANGPGQTDSDDVIVTKSEEVRLLLMAADVTVRRTAELDAACCAAVSEAKRHLLEEAERAAEQDDSAALAAARAAVEELALLRAASPRGIVARTAIFRPPLAFRGDDPEHVTIAASILRDLGARSKTLGDPRIRRMDDDVGDAGPPRLQLVPLSGHDKRLLPSGIVIN